MAELRIGGMAIIVYSINHENIGRVVNLFEFLGAVDYGPHKNRNDIWRVNSTNSPLYGVKGIIQPGQNCKCPGAWLMPIDGDDFTHEDEREKELMNG
ncbi:hypothetical protein [Dickeya poaceiphila]|uniref:Uncharacterized protein n=1 Tax=Dickeya poaceiphila TaxID=568768 RepID=A0A5B8I4K9_9GAMM|nr:hypothetical protein [Dickeya poaceiphila]QDX29531.1 hypothetical protein Dpoa569_0001306 [Dickeya poaceiphila]